MAGWTIAFLVIAAIALTVGFGNIAGAAAAIGRTFFFCFVILFLMALMSGVLKWPRKTAERLPLQNSIHPNSRIPGNTTMQEERA